MSSPSAAERLRRLEEAGVISGYKAQIDPEALGYGVTVYIRIRPMAGQVPRVAELLPSIKEVVMCDRITGEDCFIAKAHLPNIIDLETLIDKLMPYAQTNTSVVQSSPVALRLPPLPE
jgi:Lrp/AsnC family transcriptional regulator, leucine-responsive regulatory protein